VRVGDSAKEVLERFRSEYEGFEGDNSDGKNIGWFLVKGADDE